MKEVTARTVDAIIVAKMKQEIIDSSSIYQVGGAARPQHSRAPLDPQDRHGRQGAREERLHISGH